MCSESLPKEFEKTTEVLPLSTYGLSTVEEFRKAENKVHHEELLRKAGLSSEELKLFRENEAGLLDRHTKIESTVLKRKLEEMYSKINNFKNSLAQSTPSCSSDHNVNTASNTTENIIERIQDKPIKFYPEAHPMNHLKEIEESLFGHLKDKTIPLTKRRKMLRHLERRKERVQSKHVEVETNVSIAAVKKAGSLWDVKEISSKETKPKSHIDQINNSLIGPKRPTVYTIKDNRIVRLEPGERNPDEYRAVNIVAPINSAEVKLLEGTKMCLDDIKKIDRFKDYEPGVPSKVLYLKNIAPSVSQEQISLLFKQFTLDNGGPIDVRLLSGRMRGQAFVAFQDENLAIQALQEVNGTILSGRPIIVQFGRNSNRIQNVENR